MISEWATRFNIKVVPCEQRPDNPAGEIVYRIKDIFTTRNGSWEPANEYGGIPQWARDVYLKPWGAPDYFDDAGGDHHLFALVLGLDGKPVKTDKLVRYWSDGIAKLGDPGYTAYVDETPKQGSGWANIVVFNNYSPEAGQQGAWCWCPRGAADVVVGGGMPNNHHVSTFVVWEAKPRKENGGGGGGGSGGSTSGEYSITFSLAPQPSTPGAMALQWQVQDVKSVSLDGQVVAASVFRKLKAGETTRYAVRIDLADGAAVNLDVTAQATAKPSTGGGDPGKPSKPGVTRPPTVVLAAENVAHLRSFPRPPQDNGIGLHFHLDLPDPQTSRLIADTVEHLESIRATWTLIYAQDEQQAARAARPCWAAGIMPVVRIGAKINGPSIDPGPYVRLLKAIGAPPYVQVYNEPEDPREWVNDQRPDDWARIFGRNWGSTAAAVIREGGCSGIQVLTREAFNAAVDAVPGKGQAELWKHAFFVQHNYAENHPPAYPYDERNQQDAPGQTILGDTLGTLSFLAYAAWMKECLGFVLPIIGGEGGWLYGADKDPRYPKVEGALHAQYTQEMFDWLRIGVLSNGEPLPDYLFSITPWIAGSFTFGAQNWWGNWIRPEGKLTETIQAVQAIPPFVRKFSWD